ncbi:MAG: hypothetical protein Q9218_005928 [Villophora microphyllina]
MEGPSSTLNTSTTNSTESNDTSSPCLPTTDHDQTSCSPTPLSSHAHSHPLTAAPTGTHSATKSEEDLLQALPLSPSHLSAHAWIDPLTRSRSESPYASENWIDPLLNPRLQSPAPSRIWVDPLTSSQLESPLLSEIWVDPLLFPEANSPFASEAECSASSTCSPPHSTIDPLNSSQLELPATSPIWVDPLTFPQSASPFASNIWVDPLSAPSNISTSPSSQTWPDPLLASHAAEPHDHLQNYTTSPFSSSSHHLNIAAGQANVKMSSTSNVKKDAAWVRARLRSHKLYIDDRQVWAKYPAFNELVLQILNQSRQSEVNAKEVADYHEVLQIYSVHNEDTFLGKILPFFIQPSRTVSSADQHEAIAGADADGLKIVKWHQSGLIEVWNREFARTFLPFRENPNNLDMEVVKAMQKEDKMTNPKPDRTFATAISKADFPPGLRLPEDVRQYLEIMPDTHNPFLTIEGKSYKGIIMEAQNQANRGGGALVLAGRLLREEVGEPDVPEGPDHRTFVFSVTLSPSVVEVWVNWALVGGDGKVEFHMTLLASRAVNDPSTLGVTRRFLHNILDWGCGARLEGSRSMYDHIIEYAERVEKELSEAAKEPSPNKKAKTK